MICSNCQQPIKEGQVFCPNCGNRIEVPVPPPPPVVSSTVVPPVIPPVTGLSEGLQNANLQISGLQNKAKKNKTLFIVFLATTILLGIATVLLLSELGIAYAQTDEANAKVAEVLAGNLLLKIDSVYNADQDGNFLSDYIEATSLSYLTVDYQLFSDKDWSYFDGSTLNVMIYNPEGIMIQGPESTDEYTFTTTINGPYGSVGWGSDYEQVYYPGFYIFVFEYDGVIVGKEPVYVD